MRRTKTASLLALTAHLSFPLDLVVYFGLFFVAVSRLYCPPPSFTSVLNDTDSSSLVLRFKKSPSNPGVFNGVRSPKDVSKRVTAWTRRKLELD